MSTAPTPSPTPEETPRASQSVERQRFVSLRNEALQDGQTVADDRTRLEEIREQDTNPEDEVLRTEGQEHSGALRDLGLALQQLLNAARASAQRSTPPTPGVVIDTIPEAFWTTASPELGGQTGEDFVHDHIGTFGATLQHALDSRLWVRGRDVSVNNQLRDFILQMRGNFVGNRCTSTISGLQGIVGQAAQVANAMDGILENARAGHNARHEPAPAVAAEYMDWRGTEDPEATVMLGVMRHLSAVANHRFWQLEHESGQPTIANRARDMLRQIQRSMIIIGPGRCTVQNMEEVSNGLRDLADGMRVILNRGERKPDDLRVDRGTDAHERAESHNRWINRGLLAGGGALLLTLALTGQAVYESFRGGAKDKDGGKEVQPRESAPRKLSAQVSVLLRGERTLVFVLPENVAPDTIGDRYKFFLKPRMGAGKQREVVPGRSNKGWTLQLTDDEVAAGGTLVSLHENVDGTWKTVSEDVLVATLEPEVPPDTKPEDKERVVDLSPDCRVSIKGDAINVQLPAAITPANIEKKFALFVAKEGDTPPGRYIPLTKGADGWTGSFAAEELAKDEVTLTIWDDSTGRVLPRGTPAKVSLK